MKYLLVAAIAIACAPPVAATQAQTAQEILDFPVVCGTGTRGGRPWNGHASLCSYYTEEDNALGDLFTIAGKSLVASRRCQCTTF